MLTIEERRAAVVAEAMSWRGTPYHTGARVKGKNGGVDCLTFLAGVFEAAGEAPHLEIPHYPPDWHLHQGAEHYLEGKDATPGILHFCTEVPGPPERVPQPGDIVMFKFGHCFAHGAIVTAWPEVIHAYGNRPVGRDDADRTSVLRHTIERVGHRNEPRARKFFSLKSWA